MQSMVDWSDDADFTSVGELRRLLAGIPDDVPVSISEIPRGAEIASLCLLSSIDGQDQRPEKVPEESRERVTNVCICEVSTCTSGIQDIHAEGYVDTAGHSDKAAQPVLRFETTQAAMNEQQMRDRIKLLADEMDANDEENRAMQDEIDGLYVKIDAAQDAAA